MKYKVIGIAVCILVIVICAAVPAVEAYYYPESGRYHQHVSATLRPEDEVDDGTFNSHLPLVLIDTGGADIPGYALHDPDRPGYHLVDENHNYVYATAEDGSTEIIAEMNIIDNSDVVNRVDDSPSVSSKIRIHVRGNSSREFDKTSYKIVMVNEDESNKDESIMGMPAHHDWVLYGPYLDKTLIRNYMWYNIAGEIMDYAPNVRFCEVFLNGEYRGLYVMAESITAGKNGARLPLTVRKKRNTYSGYLLRMDKSGGVNDESRVNSFTTYTLRNKMGLEIIYPGRRNITPEIAESIRQDFSSFEKALYSYDFDTEQYGYKALLDTTSFIDYFILNEFTSNYDAGWMSTYIYKSRDGMFRMCIWDFNSSCDNYQETVVDHYEFEMQNCLWYVMLFKDPDFVDELINRYRFLRTNFLSDDYLFSYIEDTIAYLGPAIERNFSVWGYSFNELHLLEPLERNPIDYDHAVNQLYDYLDDRGAWMDKNIDALKHYASPSRTKKFNENAN